MAARTVLQGPRTSHEALKPLRRGCQVAQPEGGQLLIVQLKNPLDSFRRAGCATSAASSTIVAPSTHIHAQRTVGVGEVFDRQSIMQRNAPSDWPPYWSRYNRRSNAGRRPSFWNGDDTD
ncbi:hypothetical protein [Caballeronia pedi]|uniref:hypothetical protein n=1 Tax=Caballeronia pedi TaxID=1777141 RepID=UPI000772A68B|nr:hypothetical protein [Caballeronia pedi]